MIQASPECCEEASLLSGAAYLPCNAPATKVVGWKGRTDKPIRMCEACANHNVKNRGGYIVCSYPTTAPVDGELYWVLGVPAGRPFIAEYREKNQDRTGRPAGPCFWEGVREVPGSPSIISHVKRPEIPK